MLPDHTIEASISYEHDYGSTICEGTSNSEKHDILNKLVLAINKELERGRNHPILLSSEFTAFFLALRPYKSENERLSMLLIDFLLLNSGFGYVSCFSLESEFEKTKDLYRERLAETIRSIDIGQPDWRPFFDFLLTCLLRQLSKFTSDFSDEVNQPYLAGLSRSVEKNKEVP